MATDQEKRKAATSSPPWDTQVEEDVDIIERDKTFKTPDKLKRTPVTSHVLPNANIQAAPKKPSSSKTATEQAQRSNAHAHDHTLSPTKRIWSSAQRTNLKLKTRQENPNVSKKQY
jgi:hypothetical protein